MRRINHIFENKKKLDEEKKSQVCTIFLYILSSTCTGNLNNFSDYSENTVFHTKEKLFSTILDFEPR